MKKLNEDAQRCDKDCFSIRHQKPWHDSC